MTFEAQPLDMPAIPNHSGVPARCPQCDAGAVKPIVYGYPTPETMRQEERGEVVLGGCLFSPEAPSWECSECGARGGGRKQ